MTAIASLLSSTAVPLPGAPAPVASTPLMPFPAFTLPPASATAAVTVVDGRQEIAGSGNALPLALPQSDADALAWLDVALVGADGGPQPAARAMVTVSRRAGAHGAARDEAGPLADAPVATATMPSGKQVTVPAREGATAPALLTAVQMVDHGVVSIAAVSMSDASPEVAQDHAAGDAPGTDRDPGTVSGMAGSPIAMTPMVVAVPREQPVAPIEQPSVRPDRRLVATTARPPAAAAFARVASPVRGEMPALRDAARSMEHAAVVPSALPDADHAPPHSVSGIGIRSAAFAGTGFDTSDLPQVSDAPELRPVAPSAPTTEGSPAAATVARAAGPVDSMPSASLPTTGAAERPLLDERQSFGDLTTQFRFRAEAPAGTAPGKLKPDTARVAAGTADTLVSVAEASVPSITEDDAGVSPVRGDRAPLYGQEPDQPHATVAPSVNVTLALGGSVPVVGAVPLPADVATDRVAETARVTEPVRLASALPRLLPTAFSTGVASDVAPTLAHGALPLSATVSLALTPVTLPSPMPVAVPLSGAAVPLADPVHAGVALQTQPVAIPVTGEQPEISAGAVRNTTLRPPASLAPPTRVAVEVPAAPLPTPTSARAAQVFAAAIHRALGEQDARPTSDPAAALAPVTPALPGVAATGTAAHGALDMRHAAWPAAMIERIVTLRDMAAENDTRLRLSPDMLGTIDVSLKRDGDQVQVQITAEQAQTRQLLAEAQPRLAELADARGVKLQLTGGQAGGGDRPGGDAPRHHPSTPVPTRPQTAAHDDAGSTDQRIA